MNESSDTRRDFVRKAAYVAPAILTLAAAPSFAKFGSEKGNDKPGKPEDKDPGGPKLSK